MDYLKHLEARSIYVIREAFFMYEKPAMLWSIGKDSTALLWMVRRAFMGEVPFPVVHIDTGYKFKEIYEFRDKLAKEWQLDLRVAQNDAALEAGMGPNLGTKLDCCTELKTNAFKTFIAEMGFDAVLLGIRRDEHGIRSKERYFSPRNAQHTWNYKNQPPELWDQFRKDAGDNHVRVHPILHMTELDIWRYTRSQQLPTVPLYFARDGKRYRSIGCECCCSPVDSEATSVDDVIVELEVTTESERSGRAQDKEDAYTMQKLRALGYM